MSCNDFGARAKAQLYNLSCVSNKKVQLAWYAVDGCLVAESKYPCLPALQDRFPASFLSHDTAAASAPMTIIGYDFACIYTKGFQRRPLVLCIWYCDASCILSHAPHALEAE